MKLEQAARALLAHWDTPAWKYLKPTGDLMADLREALERSDVCSDDYKECRHCGWLCKPNDKESRNWHPLGAEQKELCPLCGDGKLYEHTMYRCKGCGSELADARLMDKNKALSEQAEQEPVGWYKPSDFVLYRTKPDDVFVYAPLYAAPVRTKDLTDEEITNEWESMGRGLGKYTEFARAVIAADREKNRG